MMKLFSYTFILFLSLLFHSVYGTHITGGELSYDYLGNNIYKIRLKVYRDCGPANLKGTGFDNPCYIGVYKGNGGGLHTTFNIPISGATVSLLPSGVNNPCLIFPPEVCIEEAIYQVQITLLPEEFGYDLVYQRCCRTPSIINLESAMDQGMTCHTHIPGTSELIGTNSSAYFVNLPPALMCTGEIFSMDHSAFDADGDVLQYYLCEPYLGANEVSPLPTIPLPPPYTEVNWADGFDHDYPISSSPAFSVNPTTGQFSGQPTEPGHYVFAICVDEIRNGVVINTVKRDYMIQVVLCSQTNVAAIAPQPDPCVGYTLQFVNNSSGGDVFYWDFGVQNSTTDVSTEQNPTFTFPDYGTYTVTLIVQPGAVCGDTTYSVVQVNPENPLVMDYAFSKPEPCDSSRTFQFAFTGENADVVTWNFGDNTSAEGPIAYHEYEASGLYTVEITIENELCETTETATFEVFTDEPVIDVELCMPNVFTPNGDRLNEEFRPFSPAETALLPEGKVLYDFIDLFELKVYNRWGQLVFDNGTSKRGWDGNFNGEKVKGDTYYYITKYSLLCSDKELILDGYVTVRE